MPILGSSNSAANKDRMSKIWTNVDTIIRLCRKHCGKRRNCSLQAISPFPTMFSKVVCCIFRQNEYLWSKGLNTIQGINKYFDANNTSSERMKHFGVAIVRNCYKCILNLGY